VNCGEEMYEWLQEQILNEMKTPGASVNLYNALNLSLKYDSMNNVKQLPTLTLIIPLPNDHAIMAIFPLQKLSPMIMENNLVREA